MSQDVIPAEAIQVTYALIDEITSEIILNIDHRLQKFEALQYFLNSLPEPSRKTKELHVQVAAILTAVTAWDPYDTTFEDSKQSATADDESLLEKAPPLVYWSAGQWDELSARIYTLMEALDVGYDATLESVFSSIILHEKLSKIRRQLEEQLAKKSSGQVDMHSDLIAQFAEDIMSTEEQGLRNELENLLVGADARATRSKRVPALSLKPIEELKFTMRDAPFAFGYFQRKLEKLMLHWARGSIPSLKSTLEENAKEFVPH
ncbi:hypothetical protein MHU86_10013 [Fragilaria crotonensis]|nr:hypothetical protein MHU86_10013 [Fragilaria crotonensis]